MGLNRMTSEKQTPASAANLWSPSLDRTFWRNWYVLLGVAVGCTVGLASAMVPMLRTGWAGVWPWQDTTYVLLIGLSLVVAGLGVTLTHRQREIVTIRKRFQQLQDQTGARTVTHRLRVLALLNIARVTVGRSDLQGVLDGITNLCMEGFDCQQVSLMLLDRRTHELEARSATGHESLALVLGAHRRVGQGVSGWVAKRRQPVLINSPLDARHYPGLELRDPSLSAAMVVPIVVGDDLIGVLNVSSRSSETRYTEEDLYTLGIFAENVGVCVQRLSGAESQEDSLRG